MTHSITHHNPVITIDGPSGAGKGTLAYRLATALGFNLLDSGALYRIIGLVAYEQGILNDHMLTHKNYPQDFEGQITDLARSLQIDFVVNPVTKMVDIVLNNKPLAADIRNEKVGKMASSVATLPKLREALLTVQRQMADRSGLVADGRDMGTVVFPNATAKFFLTADSRARAIRRANQLKQMGKAFDFEQILMDIERRDRQDETRQTAPSRPADDALVIDSSAMSADEVYALVEAHCARLGINFPKSY